MSRPPFAHLPTTVLPTNYTLQLHPDLTTFTFTGTERISVTVVTPHVTCIKLNCAEIKVETVEFVCGETVVKPDLIQLETEDETLNLVFVEDLPVGPAHLHINFSGVLNDKLRGFYRSWYQGSDGVVRDLAVTQFCATDARRAFPCWDEPDFKATFDVTLVSSVDNIALSNMSAVKEDLQDGLKITTFAQSPIMSTYLLAFVVGQFDFVEARDVNGVLIRVYTPVGKREQGQFALDVAVKTLPFYDNYFQIPYPLPKCDMIAIPDFAFSAMENWGLVTYRDTALLVDPEHASSAAKQRIAIMVGHELAHQWFGNLVTMQWWTHLWLNEGFASWIEYLCVDHCFPDWNIWLQYIDIDLKGALKLDALETSHPIEVPVQNPDQIGEIFDAVSYDKGNCIIRMLHSWLGAAPFRSGLAHYLKKHQYKNTVTEDLWASLQSVSGAPVNTVMSTWTSKMGYPLLDVQMEESGDTARLHIRQQKFSANSELTSDYEWHVPVTIITQSSSTPQTFLLDKQQDSVVLEAYKPGDWVKVNAAQIGLYRVRYSEELLSRLFPAIEKQELGPADRLGVQEDVFAVAKAGYCTTATFLGLVSAYCEEKDYTVLRNISTNLDELLSVHSHLPVVCRSVNSMKRRIFTKILADLGWECRSADSHTDVLLRDLTIGVLGRCGDQAVIDKCHQLFKEHVGGESGIPADIQTGVYSTVRQSGQLEHYTQLLALFDGSEVLEEKGRIQKILGDGPNPALRTETLLFAIGDKVRSNDTPHVIGGVAESGSEGREQAWQFLQQHFSLLSGRCTGGTLFQRLVKSACSNFSDMQHHRDVSVFFSQHPVPSADRAIRQSLENISLRAAWLKRDEEAIVEWVLHNQE